MWEVETVFIWRLFGKKSAMLEEGSDSSALASMAENASQSEGSRLNGPGNKCSACGEPTKGHLGPYWAAKCIAGALRKLTTRVDELENNRDLKDQHIRKMEDVHAKRIDGLFVTIENLQGKVERITERICEFEESESCRGKRKVRGDHNDGHASAVSPEEKISSCSEVLPTSSGVNPVETGHAGPEELKHKEVKENEEEEKRQPEEPKEKQPTLRSTNMVRHVHADIERSANGSSQMPISVDAERMSNGDHDAKESAPWTAVVSRRGNKKSNVRDRENRTQSASARQPGLGLHGAKRGLRGAAQASIGIYHLSGIDLDCSSDDVVYHCKKHGVVATACFMLKRRAHHTTQTAKLYSSGMM